MDVQIENSQRSISLDPAPWRDRLLDWMARLDLPAGAVLSVTLVDDAAIAELNREHRAKDRPTDVLSFPAPADFPAPAGGPIPLGDIVVSLERAAAQAGEYGHSFDRELGFLLTHGLLHLLGYDHEEPEDERAMRARQEALLARASLTRDD